MDNKDNQNITKIEIDTLFRITAIIFFAVTLPILLSLIYIIINGNSTYPLGIYGYIFLFLGLLYIVCGMIFFILGLHPNSNYLLLTPEGFTETIFFKSKFTKWSDVKELKLYSPSSLKDLILMISGIEGRPNIAYNFTDTYKNSDKYKKPTGLRNIIFGNPRYDAIIIGRYKKMDDIYDLMNKYKKQYSSS